MTSTRVLVGLLLATMAFATAGQAQAQQPSQAQANAVRQNCRADYQSYCASVPTGTQASLQCLQQHQAELTPPCKGAVAALQGGGSSAPPAQAATRPPPPAMSPRQEAALMRHSCGADYRAWCRGMPLGGGRALACLEENRSHLSRSCRTALAEAKAMR